MTDMAVAIVSFNTAPLLRTCLTSVLRNGALEVIVVDNASTDGSVGMVRTEFPSVRIYANSTNIGYGSAGNQAVAASAAPYVLLLNADTLLSAGTLGQLVSYLDRHPRAGIVGPRLIDPSGSLQPSCHAFPTPFTLFLRESGLENLVARLTDMPRRSHTTARAVPWVLGAALAIRRRAFDEVGGFDPSFFMYCEEVDLCYRLKAAGWEVHFAPVTDVVHLGGASTGHLSRAMYLQYLQSTTQFYRRYYSPRAQAAFRAIMKSAAFARLIRDVVRSHTVHAPDDRAALDCYVATWREVLRH